MSCFFPVQSVPSGRTRFNATRGCAVVLCTLGVPGSHWRGKPNEGKGGRGGGGGVGAESGAQTAWRTVHVAVVWKKLPPRVPRLPSGGGQGGRGGGGRYALEGEGVSRGFARGGCKINYWHKTVIGNV